ncbi:MAG: hypothetical protein PHU62_00930 [Bacteroidales bacterium]|jgi:hypothetical protein|nr:hypothetical protein [Bacteroidales bacterium]MDD3152077.1 hypothetical protein [Bacteroidales bacterium]MDD3913219.1 hypothetical protein [Bacteroidales bacterium]MDD4633134.1 hypothetical protein [Bacteroidales bacterium]
MINNSIFDCFYIYFNVILNHYYHMNYQLTKSKYIRGLQCDKALYLNEYKKHEGIISAETRKKFDKGREFEASFKNTFADGIALDKKYGGQMSKYVSFTKKILKQDDEAVLFEAGFVYNEILVLTDVLQKRQDGSVVIYEIKNSTELTDVIRADLSIQYYVCRK